MGKTFKLKTVFLSLLGSMILLFVGLTVLIISLFAANRRQAADIKEISTEIIKVFTQP